MAYSTPPVYAGFNQPPSAPGFNVNPAPHGGTNAYGKVPGAVGLPNPYADLSAVYPNLGPTNAAVSGNIMSELKGQLSPSTINQLKDAAASFGVSTGMPGSQFASYQGLRNLGLTTEQLQQQGLKNYNAAIPTISGTQTVNPALQANIAEQNAINAAAPDPTLAAEEQQRRFDEYLNKLMNWSPAGPTGFDPFKNLPPGTVQTAPNTYHSPAPAGY